MREAADLAKEFLEPLGRRWHHVRAVAAKAELLNKAVAEQDRDTLLAAAWLHDIGYSPKLRHTHFHPLDGARYLRAGSWPEQVVNLVAHHSGARFEAAERGLSTGLSEFPLPADSILDVLVTADLTTGPGGEALTYNERIAEILKRYPPDDPVHRTWVKAAPILKECVVRTEERLARVHPR